MKILTFKYTKADASTSSRVLLPMTSPAKGYFGVDISELDFEEQAEVALKFEALQQEFYDKVGTLLQEYDISKNFRNFLVENMSEIVEDEL
jgi:hypothetical protein